VFQLELSWDANQFNNFVDGIAALDNGLRRRGGCPTTTQPHRAPLLLEQNGRTRKSFNRVSVAINPVQKHRCISDTNSS
jgi:hypothetical protein